jgi:hypothetical protein
MTSQHRKYQTKLSLSLPDIRVAIMVSSCEGGSVQSLAEPLPSPNALPFWVHAGSILDARHRYLDRGT